MIITNRDKYDEREFHDFAGPKMQETLTKGAEKVSTFDDFAMDVFSGLMKYAPKVKDVSKLAGNEHWASKLYNEMSSMPEWKTLRETTMMSTECSMFAAQSLLENVLPKLPTPLNKGLFKDRPQNEVDTDFQDMFDKMSESQLRFAIRNALTKAQESAEDMKTYINAFSAGDGMGTPTTTTFQEKQSLAMNLMKNQKLQKIAAMAGRMKSIAMAKQRSKTKHGVDEIADIVIGDDLSRLVPAELMKLAHPLLKLDFYKKFLDKQLLQYQLSGSNPENKGPIVFCIDESDSMLSDDRDVWAKAVGMAILQIAIKQKRKCAFIHFSDGIGRVDRFEGKFDADKVIDAVTYFTGGGTNFMVPLSEAVEIIKSEKEFKKADIIMITDGTANVQSNWLEPFNLGRKIGGYNVISVVIGTEDTTCKHFSDQVIRIKNTSNDEAATNTVFNI